ncbi:MAG: ABC-2 family transporter protein [Clostridia bacterium]|nr:ABC-2 family transporter protein [Clostridia bacterium]
MKKYFSFFRMRLMTSVQYRASYVSGLITQFPWGMMECFAYMTLNESQSGVFPMELSSVVAYIWLKEAFFMMLTTWNTDNDIMESIVSGGVGYELCRPLSIYGMWFARSAGGRIAAVLSRSLPIMLVALVLPKPLRLMLPESLGRGFLFAVSLLLGAGVAVALCMLVYLISFFTITPKGVRRLMVSMGDLLSGGLIPLPFVPQPWRALLELLPFASIQNTPYLVYSGELAGTAAWTAMGLQMFWLAALILLGQLVCMLAQRRIVIQGG